MQQEVYALIVQTQLINNADKNFLIGQLPYLNSVDLLRLRNSLASANPAEVLQNLQMIKARFFQQPSFNQPIQNPNPAYPQQPQTQFQTSQFVQPAQSPVNQNSPAANPFQTQQFQPNQVPPQQNATASQDNSGGQFGVLGQNSPAKKEGIFQQIANVFQNKKEPQPVSQSILSQSQLIGSPVVQPVKVTMLQPFNSLMEFQSLDQLSLVSQQHVSFGLDKSDQQIIQNFLDRLSELFNSINNISLKRSYFMNFLQSPLFNSYINSAITALKHPELQPRNIVLNILNQGNGQFLNLKQFSYAAQISNHVRNLAGL